MDIKIKYKAYWALAFIIVILAAVLFKIYLPNTLEEAPPLIPREVLFNDSESYKNLRISPDGKWLTYLAPKDGIANVWARDLVTGKTKVLTHKKKRDIGGHSWAFDSQYILYTRDENGDENSRLYKVDVQSGVTTLLTPEKGVKAFVIQKSHLHPHKILIGLNDRDPAYHDVYILDISTGRRTLLLENRQFTGFIFDDDFNLIFAGKQNSRGETEYYQSIGKNKWVLYRTVALEDIENTAPLGLDASKQWMYWKDSEGSDKTNLVKMHLKTKERQVLFKGKKADLNFVMIDSTTKAILAVGENYLRWTVTLLTPDMKEDFKILDKVETGEITIVSRTRDNQKWVVSFDHDDKPCTYYLYDRITKKAAYLFTGHPKWEGLLFVKMQPVEIKSRDGLTLVSYLSLPKHKKKGIPVPMVVMVHGGPIGFRNTWGLSSSHQYWANRGYAVLYVNYRGSGGFGKAFIKAAYGEWGRKMHDDLIDAVNWAIKEKIAEPKKIAIVGSSYGGYAALVGATMTPDVFACAVDIIGPSNLITFLETIPPYWKVAYENLKIRLGGDPATLVGKALLRSRSPLTYVDDIKKPLLIMHGANDPRVKKSESDQIVNAMKKKGIPVTYALFPDEGHGFRRTENKLASAAMTEAFLHENLGGRLEPLGDEMKNSSMQILAGKVATL